MILVKTNHPVFGAEHHSWYQSITCIIHRVWPYFQKKNYALTVRKHLYAHIRTIVVLTGGKLARISFLQLLYATYYSVMTHLGQGKKLSSSCRGM
jgi:hypothetical protein